jgi:hypothetical protein
VPPVAWIGSRTRSGQCPLKSKKPVRRGFRESYCHDRWRPGPQQRYGFTIGRWEGITFVVEAAGFKEGSWLGKSGHPHTDALSTTECFRAGFRSTGNCRPSV